MGKILLKGMPEQEPNDREACIMCSLFQRNLENAEGD